MNGGMGEWGMDYWIRMCMDIECGRNASHPIINYPLHVLI